MPSHQQTRIDPEGQATAQRSATFRPSTYDQATNSLELCWSTGALGLRFDWWDGEIYEEELSMEPGAVRLERLNAGATLLDSHQDRTLKSVLGSVMPGTARLEGGEGVCRVRLATTPDVADTNQKIIDGHIRNVSVGYAVHQYLRTEEPGQRAHMLATDWEPTEISMVAVPFDRFAQTRTRSENMPRIIENQDDTDDSSQQRGQRPLRTVTPDQIRERCSRADDISRAFERQLLDDHAEHPFTRAQLDQAIADELVRVRETPPIDSRRHDRGHPNGSTLVRDFTDALTARLTGREAPEHAREYRHASMIDMARALLEQRGESVRWDRPAAVLDKLARYGAHTTSDFAGIIANAGRMVLVETFRSTPSPLKLVARKRDFPDFKERFSVSPSGAAQLRHVAENAEYKRVTFTSTGQSSKLNTYGEIFPISRQALINDDLGVFTDMTKFWARAQSETEASYLVAMIGGNGVVLADGKTLYHADHGNLAGAGAAISIASLSAARQSMRTVKNDDGVTPANVVPKYLVVGAAKETEAEQVLAAIAAATANDANPFSGKLELVVDPRLIGNSWRLFADPEQTPVLEYGNLEGQDGLFTDARVGFDVDGVEFKARTDIGAGVVDSKGSYLNPGN